MTTRRGLRTRTLTTRTTRPRPAMLDIRPPGHTWRLLPVARDGPAKGAVGGAAAADGKKAPLSRFLPLWPARPPSLRCAAPGAQAAILTLRAPLKGVRPASVWRLPESSPRAVYRPGSREWRSKHHAGCAKPGGHRSISGVDLGVVTVERPRGGYIRHKGKGGSGVAQKVSSHTRATTTRKRFRQGQHRLRRFSIDGRDYEIDLCLKHSEKFDEAVRRYATHARKASARVVRTKRRTAAHRKHSAQVRAWAKANGFTVSERGRIPADVVNRYDSRTASRGAAAVAVHRACCRSATAPQPAVLARGTTPRKPLGWLASVRGHCRPGVLWRFVRLPGDSGQPGEGGRRAGPLAPKSVGWRSFRGAWVLWWLPFGDGTVCGWAGPRSARPACWPPGTAGGRRGSVSGCGRGWLPAIGGPGLRYTAC